MVFIHYKGLWQYLDLATFSSIIYQPKQCLTGHQEHEILTIRLIILSSEKAWRQYFHVAWVSQRTLRKQFTLQIHNMCAPAFLFFLKRSNTTACCSYTDGHLLISRNRFRLIDSGCRKGWGQLLNKVID